MKRTWQKTACHLLLSTSLLPGATPVARAQMSPDLVMETYNSNISVITNGIINKSVLDKAVARNNGTAPKLDYYPNSGRRKSTATSTSATPARNTSLTYVPTAALKQQTVQGYVERLKPTDPAASQAVATTFGPGKYDYGQIYRTLIDGHGLRDNDAADALAAYMLLSYLIVNNTPPESSTPAVSQGVRAQVSSLLAQNPRLSDAGVRAQLGEEMKLQTVIVQGGWQAAAKQKTLPAYQQGIVSLFEKQYGMNLRQYSLTNRGFAQK